MAKKDEIQYVRYYEYGTTVRRLDPLPRRKSRPLPEPKPAAKPKPVLIDPVAVFGTAVAVVMLLCMLIGFLQVNQGNRDIHTMEQYISSIQADHYTLEKEYQAGYDIEEIQTAAEAMGLVPVEQVRHIRVSIPEPEVVEKLPWWQSLWNDFRAMFE